MSTGRKPVAQQKLGELALLVWRAIASAGRDGLTADQVVAKFYTAINKRAVVGVLHNLVRRPYIECASSGEAVRWVLTRECVVPNGETRPDWLDEIDDDSSEIDERFHTGPVVVAMPPAPVSVFTLGEGWSMPFTPRDGRTRGPYRKTHSTPSADGAGATSHAVLDWVCADQSAEDSAEVRS